MDIKFDYFSKVRPFKELPAGSPTFLHSVTLQPQNTDNICLFGTVENFNSPFTAICLQETKPFPYKCKNTSLKQ